MINILVFQISVNINPQTKEVPVLLGKADNSDPKSKILFSLPDNIELKEEYSFKAIFSNWEIKSLLLNDIPLFQKIRPGTITFWFEPQKNIGAFTKGVNVNWGRFIVNGENCTVISKGKTLLAYLNKDTSKEILIFSRELEVDTSKAHMIAITWSNEEMNLYFDDKHEQRLDIRNFK